MILIIHGYLLDGSGSSLWTRSIVQALCRAGETVHLACQEPHPEQFDFIAEAYRFTPAGKVETVFRRDVPYGGRCIMHKPWIGATLPVYVWDHYEEYSDVVPMIELSDDVIEGYVRRNAEALTHVVRSYGVTAMHVNHAVLMSAAVERVGKALNVAYAVMPHGSDIEYAVKKDERFLRLAEAALAGARRIFVIGGEMRRRVAQVIGSLPDISEKMAELNLGADTDLFEPVGRGARPASVKRMLGRVAELPRGKTPAMTQALTGSLSGGMTEEALGAAIKAARGYTAKLSDADLESKLLAVDWQGDDLLLFVGRIIASKGLQSVIAAMPLILDERPGARLLVVGHGPLREAMEALVWALGSGERSLVEKIVALGSSLEGSAARPLSEVARFYDSLKDRGELDAYFDKARRLLRADSVIFTGYLTHAELRYLFPCSDVAVFPSVVAEAGPLVFLEALASGCFPLGTYFAGMAASIDSAAAVLPAEDAELMKLSPDEDKTVADIAAKAAAALALGGKHKRALRRLAVERYDWKSVAKRLAQELRSFSG
jgi:glycosyltransferase involved in cell wall biosynthesis